MGQGVIHGDARKPVALETLIRLPQCSWNVRRGHRDPQNLFLGKCCAGAGHHHQADKKLLFEWANERLMLGFKRNRS